MLLKSHYPFTVKTIKQPQLASLFGVSRQTMSTWMNRDYETVNKQVISVLDDLENTLVKLWKETSIDYDRFII